MTIGGVSRVPPTHYHVMIIARRGQTNTALQRRPGALLGGCGFDRRRRVGPRLPIQRAHALTVVPRDLRR